MSFVAMMRYAAITVLSVGLAAPAVAACPGYGRCPGVDYPAVLKTPVVRAVQAGIDATEAAAVKAAQGDGISFGQLVGFLGQALVYDRSLSANGREACALCHGQATGFAGGIAAFAKAGGVFPGAVMWRTGPRAPQSLAYAAYAPVLAYRAATRDFAGGNFRDSRATGAVTGSPAADQTSVPLTSAFEMALPDAACAVRRVALAPYGALFAKVWGAASLAIRWPADTDRVCARPAEGGAGAGQAALALSKADRARAALSVQQIGLTVATFEADAASPFSAKFDAMQAGRDRFSEAERRGYALFTGRGRCVSCHAVAGQFPVFTDYTSANIGVPRNPALPFLRENVPDRRGYVANPAGDAFVDEGFGGFLASGADTNADWRAQAGRFMGAFQVPTLRNAAAVPSPGFPRVYMHNGVFSDVRMVVHFLNTRDVLPRCAADGEIGVNCWPAPEEPRNVEHVLTGNLGLSARQESDLVAFVATLNDGFGERLRSPQEGR